MMSIGTAAVSSGSGGEENNSSLPENWADTGHQRGTELAQQDTFARTLPNMPQTTHFRLTESQWSLIERGLRQRFEAVTACVEEITRNSRIPAYLSESPGWTTHWRTISQAVSGLTRNDVNWAWFASSDLYLSANGDLSVLDHNFSLPTGLDRLAAALTASNAPFFSEFTRQIRRNDGLVFVLDPGPFAATFRGNEFLSRILNAKIGKASDLVVRADGVFLQSTSALSRVSTIVRRIDDDLLDPNAMRPDSLVGLPGLVRAWRNGVVNVVSPPGASLANIRSFGRMIPAMIRQFLSEEPVLNSARVIECSDSESFERVLERVTEYAIRTNDPLHPARPYFGRTGLQSDLTSLLGRIRRNPEAYVARPLLSDDEASGMSLRLYSSLGSSFRLLKVGLARMSQPDGGAPLIINPDAPMALVE